MIPNEIAWSPGITLDAIEKMVILKAYYHFRNNKTTTAKSLGISIRTLDTRLEQYEMELIAEEERQHHEQRKRTEFLARQRGNPPNNIGVPFTPGSSAHLRNHESYERHFPGPETRVRMESIANASEKSPLSLPERSEIQTMLPKNTSPGSKIKGR